MKNSPFTAFLLSALSQDDMQFIPGVFYKPFSLILRCKSPQAMARLSVSQPLEEHSIQTDRQAGGHADRKTENNAGNCIRIEWEAGYYLGKKVGAEKEEDGSVRVGAHSERLGRQECRRIGRSDR